MNPLKKYSNFLKIEHSLFSLPLLFAGALMAKASWPSLKETLLILMAGGCARIVALVLNRIIDRKIDALNPRTQDRHLVSGKMKLWEAGILGLLALVVYLFASWSLSEFCLKLSWIPLIGFAAYPYFKRITKWTHVGLGIVWAMIPIAGHLAVKPSFEGSLPSFTLALFSIFWLAGFDIIYATMDEEVDRQTGVKSLPSAWGAQRALKMASIFHFWAFVILVLFYGFFLSGPLTVLSLGVVGILLFAEHRMASDVNLAVFHINTIIGFVVLLMVMSGIKGI